MLIINVRNNANNKWKRKTKKKKTKNMQRSGASYSASVRAKWFSCKLGFVQLILSKASLMLSQI